MNRPRTSRTDFARLYAQVIKLTGWTYQDIDNLPRSRFWEFLRNCGDEPSPSHQERRSGLR